MDRLKLIQDILSVLPLLLQAFKSDPEARKMRALIKRERALSKYYRNRYKYILRQRKLRDRGKINQQIMEERIADYDLHNPKP